MAAQAVLSALKALGSPNPTVRAVSAHEENAIPLKTDQDFYIIKAPFPKLLIASEAAQAGGTGKTTDGAPGKLWEVDALATAIKMIPGVLEVGIFTGVNGVQAQAQGQRGGQKPVAVYFGMEDGSVKVRRSEQA